MGTVTVQPPEAIQQPATDQGVMPSPVPLAKVNRPQELPKVAAPKMDEGTRGPMQLAPLRTPEAAPSIDLSIPQERPQEQQQEEGQVLRPKARPEGVEPIVEEISSLRPRARPEDSSILESLRPLARPENIQAIEETETADQAIETVSNQLPMVDNPLDFIFKQGLVGLDETNTEHQESIKGFLNTAVPNFVKDKSEVTSGSKAWCAAFVDHVLTNLGQAPLQTKDRYDRIRAKQYLNYGDPVADAGKAKAGDLVILKTPDGFHVSFFTSVSEDGKTIEALGGNQDNKVQVSKYDISQVRGIRRIGNIRDADTETIKDLTVDIAEGASSSR